MEESFYKTLGVDVKASLDTIKAAYKKLALKFHPDRNRESEKTSFFFFPFSCFSAVFLTRFRRRTGAIHDHL